MMMTSRIGRAPLLAVLSATAIWPSIVSAQAVEPTPAVRVNATSGTADDGYRALGAELLRFNDRVAALERLVTQLVARQDEDHRGLAALTDELTRFRLDAEAWLKPSAPSPSAGATLAEPGPMAVAELLPVPATRIDRFEQALAFAVQEDWPNAELAFETFITNNPGDERLAKARYQLGTAYLEQGQAGQAAGIFLDLFETGAAGDFGAENLFALARALRELDDVDAGQICSVYVEIDQTYGTQLGSRQREELLDLQLASSCGQ